MRPVDAPEHARRGPAGAPDGGAEGSPWRRRSRRTAYENPWIEVWHDDVVRPDGADGIYGVVHYRNVAVAIVAVDGAGRIPLVRQWRYTLDEPSWEIPEGGVPLGEPPRVGAQRELREETGLTAAGWLELGRLHLSNSVSDELAVLYLATDLTVGEAALEGTESDIEVRWVGFEEALAMSLDGRITDALSVVSIQRVALTRLAAAMAEQLASAPEPDSSPSTGNGPAPTEEDR